MRPAEITALKNSLMQALHIISANEKSLLTRKDGGGVSTSTPPSKGESVRRKMRQNMRNRNK